MQRRKHPRFNIQIPVTIRSGKKIIQGQVEDISLGGAFISCKEQIPKDTEVFIQFQGDALIELRGKITDESAVVRWANPSNCIGIQFKDLKPENKNVLKELLAKLSGASH